MLGSNDAIKIKESYLVRLTVFMFWLFCFSSIVVGNLRFVDKVIHASVQETSSRVKVSVSPEGGSVELQLTATNKTSKVKK